MSLTGPSVYVPITNISFKSGFNPRQSGNDGFSSDKMNWIRNSIKNSGLDAPLVITPIEGEKNKYQLVAGERRLRSIFKLVESNVDCFCQITHKIKSAKEIYVDHGVECKIKSFSSLVAQKMTAIHENVLHEPLTDYELLMELKWLKENGIIIPSEQGEVLAKNNSWISQSHSLLESGKEILLDYIKEEKLSRTAAITFINVPNDKIKEVLVKAYEISKQNLEIKITMAESEKKKAAEEIGKSKAVLAASDFMDDPDEGQTVKLARRSASSAVKKYKKAQDTISETKKKKPVITDSNVVKGSKLAGASENLKKPRQPSEIRKKYKEFLDLPEIPEGITQDQFDEGMVWMRWFLDSNTPDSPFDMLKTLEE